jgi:hypothetical protein
MSEERKIRFEGEDLGSYTIRQVMRMADTGEIDHTAEYWSEKGKEWRRLPSFISDFDDQPDRLAEIRAVGLTKTRILGTGANDCPACKAIQNRIFAIDDTPTLPPANCTCVPWCRCNVLSQE